MLRIPAVRNEDLVSVYSASDACVWPRQGSMSMIEAASCSRPIICCDFLAERCKNANGMLVTQDDVPGLGSALLRLIEDDDLRLRMGEKGMELVESELSWRAIARRFLA